MRGEINGSKPSTIKTRTIAVHTLWLSMGYCQRLFFGRPRRSAAPHGLEEIAARVQHHDIGFFINSYKIISVIFITLYKL
jgi:hypothetical protein